MAGGVEESVILDRVVEAALSKRNARVLVLGHSFSDLEGFSQRLVEMLGKRRATVRTLDEGENWSVHTQSSEAAEQVVVTRHFLRSPVNRRSAGAGHFNGGVIDQTAFVALCNTDAVSHHKTSLQNLMEALLPPSDNRPYVRGTPVPRSGCVFSLHDRRVVKTNHVDNLPAAVSLLSDTETPEKWPRVVSSLTASWLVPNSEQQLRQSLRNLIVPMSVSFSRSPPWHVYRPMFAQRSDAAESSATTWLFTWSRPSSIHVDRALNQTFVVLNNHFHRRFTFFPCGHLGEGGSYLLRVAHSDRIHAPAFSGSIVMDVLRSVGWDIKRFSDESEWLSLVPPITPEQRLRVGSRVWNRITKQSGTVTSFAKTTETYFKGLENTLWPTVTYDSSLGLPQAPLPAMETPVRSIRSSPISWVEEVSFCLPIHLGDALLPHQLAGSDAQCCPAAAALLPAIAVRLGLFHYCPDVLLLALRYARRPLLFHEMTSINWLRRSTAQAHSRWYHSSLAFLK